MAVALTAANIISFTDSGQEFRLDCVLTFSGTYTNGGEDASALFDLIDIKTSKFPKSAFGVTSTGASLYLDTANKKIKLFGGTTPLVANAPIVALAGAGAGDVDDGVHDYAVGFTSAAGTSAPGRVASVTVANKAADGKVAGSAVPLGPAGTTARVIYRSKAGAHALYVQSTIADNTTATFTDNVADAALTVAAPTSSSAAEFVGDLTGITANATFWFKRLI